MTKLKNGESFICPYYDNLNDENYDDFREIKPNISLILLEGMFIFRDQKLRELLDFGIYVEVDDDIRLSRMGNIFIIKVIHENEFLKNNYKAFNSFFIIYEKYIKSSFEQNIEPVNNFLYRQKNTLI